MLALLRKVEQVGTFSDQSASEFRRTLLLNRAMIGVIFLQVPVFIMGGVFDRRITLLTGLISVLLAMSSLGLTYWRQVVKARILVIVTFTLFITLLNVVFGRAWGGHLSYLLLAIGVVILLDRKSWRLAMIVLIVLGYGFSEWFYFTHGVYYPVDMPMIMYPFVFMVNLSSLLFIVIYFYSLQRDHETRAEELVNKLQAHNRALELANRELEQFTYAASHHFKSPLKNLNLITHLLERRLSHGSRHEVADLLSILKQDSQHAYRLVEDMLDFSQVSRELDLKQVPSIWVGEVVARVVSNIQGLIDRRGADVQILSNAQIPMREMHLEMVLQNLVENGLKYNESDHPYVWVWAERRGDRCLIRVRDNGIGIPLAYRQQVFAIFSRLHSAEKYEGTGIGLAVCQKIIELYGGQVAIADPPDQVGTEFVLLLPLNGSRVTASEIEAYRGVVRSHR